MVTACRLLPLAEADGPTHMAADETLLEAAVASAASLRFYTWKEPTISLGYFQRAGDAAMISLPLVRRPTGGETLVHHHELTYALAVPAGKACQEPPWMPRMHGIIAAALAGLGVSACLAAESSAGAGPLCFQHPTAGDVLVGGVKVAGSAQRKRKGAILQHGAVLLARSPHAPALLGIHERTGLALALSALCQAICHEFQDQTGWRLADTDWTLAESQRTEELRHTKYTQDWWNRKR